MHFSRVNHKTVPACCYCCCLQISLTLLVQEENWTWPLVDMRLSLQLRKIVLLKLCRSILDLVAELSSPVLCLMEGRSSDLNQYKCKKSIRLSIHYLIAIQNLNFVNMAMTPILEPIKLVVGCHSYMPILCTVFP